LRHFSDRQTAGFAAQAIGATGSDDCALVNRIGIRLPKIVVLFDVRKERRVIPILSQGLNHLLSQRLQHQS
jgi:hypothetical protein